METNKPIIGLFFGSFNPVHIGHMAIAEFMVEHTDISEVWFVVSPQSPHKQKQSMLNERDRLYLVELAIDKDIRFQTCDIEFYLPKPSYTIHTLVYLSEKHPGKQFGLIVGGDNLQHFNKWKNYEQILKYYHLFVYKRPGALNENFLNNPHVHIVDAPQMEISSSFIRKSIVEGKSVNRYLPAKVSAYIERMNFYR
jgi:nicotinate-nucleotide adenylyltransferase